MAWSDCYFEFAVNTRVLVGGDCMATRKKYYAVMKFETKEDFDKHVDDIYDSGYSHGFKDGRINALSHFSNLITEEFEPQEIDTAARAANRRNKEKWKRQQELQKGHDELVIENYLKEHNIKIEEPASE